ncbi:MAG: DsbA family protein [Endozoicomonas sp.]
MKNLLVLIAGLLLLPLSLQAAPLDAEQQQQVRELVRKTLVENPEILVEAINELKKSEAEAQKQAEKKVIEARARELFQNPDDPSRGPASDKARLTMVYFGDFNCGFCKRQDPVLEKLAKDFPELRIVYKELPVLGESSREAASLALAVDRSDSSKYFQVHNRLMAKPGQHDSTSIAAALKAEGFDVKTLKQKVDSRINQQLDDNLRLASELGIRGTPAMVFPDRIVGGFITEAALADMIRERLN